MTAVKICDEKNIHILGRTYCDENALTLFWTGSGIEADIKAAQMRIGIFSDYRDMEIWISIEVNGRKVARQMLNKGMNDICVFRGMSRERVTRVRILRETQAMSDDDQTLMQIVYVSHDGEILPFKKRKRKIEFIGDSITTGEGAIGMVYDDEWISMIESAVNGYAVMTADMLDADFDIISQSGWGASVSWDGDTSKALPRYYERICGLLSGERNISLHAHDLYDFGNGADDVVINLGTNDENACKLDNGEYDPDGIARFKSAVKAFLKKARLHNPGARIVWAYGMLGTGFLEYITEAVSDYRAESGDENVSVLKLPEVTSETIGARGHPGAENHRQAAKTLVEHLKTD